MWCGYFTEEEAADMICMAPRGATAQRTCNKNIPVPNHVQPNLIMLGSLAIAPVIAYRCLSSVTTICKQCMAANTPSIILDVMQHFRMVSILFIIPKKGTVGGGISGLAQY